MGDYRSTWRRGALAGIAGTALTVALAAGAPAHAQEADAQAATAAQGSTLTDGAPANGEIVVTATRRVSTTLRVPMSIVALNTEGLVKSNVKSMEDIARVVPGITYTANGGREHEP